MPIRNAIDYPRGSVTHLVYQSVSQSISGIDHLVGQDDPSRSVDCAIFSGDLAAEAESRCASHPDVPFQWRIFGYGVVENFFVVETEEFVRQSFFVIFEIVAKYFR